MADSNTLQRAWRIAAENSIVAAQNEGVFDNLPGLGKPLEEIMDIQDASGWVRRMQRDLGKKPGRGNQG